MAPVEAMAAGTPVVALRAGGAVETVLDGVTGVFFDRPEVDSIVNAIERVDGLTRDRAAIRAHAERFSRSVFRERFRELVGSDHREGP